MARNMDRLLREYRLKPADIAWEPYFPTREAFGRDLHRMRLPESAKRGERKLVAHTQAWAWMLELVTNACSAKGEPVTLEALAERLTRGTRFHPTRKIQTREEKLLYTLNLWPNEVDQQCGLLRTYRQLSVARAEYITLNMHEIGENQLLVEGIRSAAIRPSEYFENIPVLITAQN